jgi:hypothetical protein
LVDSTEPFGDFVLGDFDPFGDGALDSLGDFVEFIVGPFGDFVFGDFVAFEDFVGMGDGAVVIIT